MGREVKKRYHLDGSGTAVLDLLADKDFVAQRCEAGGDFGGHLVSHKALKTKITINTHSVFPLAWMPRAVRSRFKGDPTVDRVEVWDRRAKTAAVEFHVSGAPVTAQGSMRLTDNGKGCELAADVHLAVKLMLVGGMMEGVIDEEITKVLDREAELYRRSL